MAISVVACQLAMVYPHHAVGMQPLEQPPLYARTVQGLVAVWGQQTLTGGKDGATAIALYRAALEHHVIVVAALAVQQALGTQVGGDGVVVLPGKLVAPAVETEVEQLGPTLAHEGEGTVVARPGIIGVTLGNGYLPQGFGP